MRPPSYFDGIPYGVAALTAALLHRDRTGEGQEIDLAQVEASIHFIEPAVLDYTVNGRVAGRSGHESPYASPHGVYATKGEERYIAIACETAAQWRALRAMAPLAAFGADAFDALAARHAAGRDLRRDDGRPRRDDRVGLA